MSEDILVDNFAEAGELTREEAETIVDKIKEIWSNIIKVVKKAYVIATNIVKLYIYHEKKMKKEYYLSISEGKSNNWRKVRGLPLKRKVTTLC